MKVSVLAVAAALAMATPVAAVAQVSPAVTAPTPDEAALDRLVADYEAYLKSVDPLSASFEGDVEALARVPDLSRGFELAQRAPLEGVPGSSARHRPGRTFPLRTHQPRLPALQPAARGRGAGL
jgi:hypothetical protein